MGSVPHPFLECLFLGQADAGDLGDGPEGQRGPRLRLEDGLGLLPLQLLARAVGSRGRFGLGREEGVVNDVLRSDPGFDLAQATGTMGGAFIIGGVFFGEEKTNQPRSVIPEPAVRENEQPPIERWRGLQQKLRSRKAGSAKG